MTPGIDVDGDRPAVAWVTSLPRQWKVTPSERLILMCLACDAYEWESAPGYDTTAAWTGMQRSSCAEILARLCEATDDRPALLDKVSTRGRRRTVFRLRGKDLGHLEPSGHAGRLEAIEGGSEPSANQPAGPDGSSDEEDANRPAPQDGSPEDAICEPSGATGRFNRPATPDGSGSEAARTVGEPSANRPATPDAPLALNPNTKTQSQNPCVDAQGDALFDSPEPDAPAKRPAKTKRVAKAKADLEANPDPISVLARVIVAAWWDALPTKPSGKGVFIGVVRMVEADLRVGRTEKEIASALNRCGVFVSRNSLDFRYSQLDQASGQAISPGDRSIAALQAKKTPEPAQAISGGRQ